MCDICVWHGMGRCIRGVCFAVCVVCVCSMAQNRGGENGGMCVVCVAWCVVASV